MQLYKYASASYPNITSNSVKILLHTRVIDPLPLDILQGIPSTFHVGRGWLGYSSDVVMDTICPTTYDCSSKALQLVWRGNNGSSYSFSTNYTQVQVAGNASLITIPVKRLEDGLIYNITVSASRYIQVGGQVSPLFSSLTSTTSFVPADASHGVKFAAPYELNVNLTGGTYSSTQIVYISMNLVGGSSAFTTIRLSVSLKIQNVTETVDISTGKTYATQAIYSTVPSVSSVYFLSTDPSVGPNNGIWWGTWGG